MSGDARFVEKRGKYDKIQTHYQRSGRGEHCLGTGTGAGGRASFYQWETY